MTKFQNSAHTCVKEGILLLTIPMPKHFNLSTYMLECYSLRINSSNNTFPLERTKCTQKYSARGLHLNFTVFIHRYLLSQAWTLLLLQIDWLIFVLVTHQSTGE